LEHIFSADHPAFIFQVVGQSRDDVPTVASGGRPSSWLALGIFLILPLMLWSYDLRQLFWLFLGAAHLIASRRFPPPWSAELNTKLFRWA
jgi:hypothetical protein